MRSTRHNTSNPRLLQALLNLFRNALARFNLSLIEPDAQPVLLQALRHFADNGIKGKDQPARQIIRILKVRHHPLSGWLDELGRLEGGRAVGLGVALRRAYVELLRIGQ